VRALHPCVIGVMPKSKGVSHDNKTFSYMQSTLRNFLGIFEGDLMSMINDYPMFHICLKSRREIMNGCRCKFHSSLKE
jgi:hypothetical protein